MAEKTLAEDQWGSPGEGFINISPWSYSAIIQGTWAAVVSNAALYNYYYSNIAAEANADEIHYKVYLAAGTYTLNVVGVKFANGGISDVYIDAAEVASFDWYNAGDLLNELQQETGIVVASSGLKTLKVKLDGQHASSGGHIVDLQKIILFRTA